MPPTTKVDRSIASRLRRQLDSDPFIQRLAATTLFRQIPLAELSLATLEDICASADIERLPKKQSLKIEGQDVLYEILSGYVKIYDRALLPSEKQSKPIKNPPALLAWRIPGEFLGDFKFSFPEEKLTDHIVATDECFLLKLPASTVRNLAQSYPQIYLNLASNLASKAIKARIRAQILRLPNIESKVAKLFIELIKEREFDKEIRDCQVINGTFHLADIAAFLGYEKHSTQNGVLALINAGLLNHYQNKISGRFEIYNQEDLHQYLEREFSRGSRTERGAMETLV